MNQLFEGSFSVGEGSVFKLPAGGSWEAVWRWYSYTLSDGTSFTIHYWHP